jgi:hypothetical protein
VAIASRIVGLTYDDPATLLANPYNYRIHPTAQRSALAASLAELGWIDTVIVNDTTGHVIDGHLRVEDALTMNEATIPVLHVVVSEAEERKALLTLDPLAALAITDAAVLRDLMPLVASESAALNALWQGIATLGDVHPPDAFPAFDEGIETQHACPKCGYRWSGNRTVARQEDDDA